MPKDNERTAGKQTPVAEYFRKHIQDRFSKEVECVTEREWIEHRRIRMLHLLDSRLGRSAAIADAGEGKYHFYYTSLSRESGVTTYGIYIASPRYLVTRVGSQRAFDHIGHHRHYFNRHPDASDSYVIQEDQLDFVSPTVREILSGNLEELATLRPEDNPTNALQNDVLLLNKLRAIRVEEWPTYPPSSNPI